MKIKRRDFIKTTALLAGGLATGSSYSWSAESKAAKESFYDPYSTVKLGKTGITTSRFCLGTGMNGGKRESNHTRMGKEAFEALLHESYDRGTRCFDLADLYGTHPYVIPALKGIPRDKYMIITKIWFRPGGIPEPERPDADIVVRRFMKEIGTDYLDLVLLHCVTSAKWPEELRKQMDILSKFKEKGDIRALGVSCHSFEALEAAADEPWVDSVHARINPFNISMDAAPDKVVPVLKRMHDAGKGVVGMKVVGAGKLRNQPEKRQESIQYVLDLKCVDVLNVGCEKVDEIDDFNGMVKGVKV
jgi:aryl-alcohol dehydrogenase-like predicted oxidoreductase